MGMMSVPLPLGAAAPSSKSPGQDPPWSLHGGHRCVVGLGGAGEGREGGRCLAEVQWAWPITDASTGLACPSGGGHLTRR